MVTSLRPASRETPAARRVQQTGLRRGTTALVVIVVAIAMAAILGFAVGSNAISPLRVVAGLLGTDPAARTIVVGNRLPRVLLALLVGAALGLAGHLMQSLTRNPLADPGLLGIQAGASAVVVSAIAFLGISTPSGYIWFALLGSGLAAGTVYAVGSGRGSASPVRLVLAGAAISGCLYAYVSGVIVVDQYAFVSYRFWEVGTLTGRDLSIIGVVLWFLVAGVVLALLLAPSLDALALGEETATALGARSQRTRVLGIVAVTLLTAAATAAVGPIGFIGLAVPHVTRALVGPGHRWGLPLSALVGILLLLVADVLARVIAWPQEVGVGIVTAVVGAPVLVWLVRRGRVARL